MMKNILLATFCLGAVVATSSAPASACNVVGYKNGERLCSTTSDRSGYNRRTVGKYIKGVHYYPPMVKPGQPKTSSNVTPSKHKSCGSGWYKGGDGTCYPRI